MSKSLIQDDKKGEIVLTDRLSDDLKNLYLSENYSDVTFVVENEKIPSHKVILAARSEYFRALLFGGLNETNKSEVTLKVPIKAFKIILRYIYTARINLRTMQMCDILDTLGLSNLFGYEELKDEISNFLKNSLQLSNVCNILDASRLYELNSLTSICYNYIDKNAEDLLKHESFKFLYKDSLIILLSRDSFFVPEINIFQAIEGWIKSNPELTPDDIREVVSQVRLPLISLEDLLSIVRPTKILDANYLLDAIHVKTKSRVNRLPHRGRVCPEENILTAKFGAKVITGHCDGYSLLDASDHPYDMEKGYTRHTITKNDEGIIVELGTIFIINHIKLLLWDLDVRSYSYTIHVSVGNEFWEKVIDYSTFHCRSWQYIYFEKRPVQCIKITGTHNTVNKIFHLVSLQAMLLTNVPETIDGIIVPKMNVATVERSASVLEGVSRNKNSLLNGNVKDYDWDCGYTCHQLGSGNISIQLGQPYMIGSFRILLWDCDDRTYSFYIETSVNGADWDLVVDKKNERLQSWNSFSFEPRPISYIRITGTYNSANEIFHIVHIECPSQVM
ncbi:CLUMA_CG016151, isoform A [Clunio marinus]|uniref:CLUMA_CG016151, isoform A n=1 Tax=Clunio marinus TaxID=568069 RepID=A0A1J1IUA6_9DIPT|nr:CLUMA_CG016151, isoform A [Clunio marinus]